MKWLPMRKAPKNKGAQIIALGRDAWPANGPLFVADCICWRIGRDTGWSRSNGGHGWTVEFKPVKWLPYPEK